MNIVIDRLKALSAKIIELETTILLSALYLVGIPFVWLLYRVSGHRLSVGWKPWKYQTDTLDACRSEASL
jgi:hypothetical protein